MAIKIGDALGIIGRGMQDVSPVVAAKEKALRDTETASLIRQEDKYKFLIEEL